MASKKKKAELRLYITPKVDRLVRTLSGLTDQTISDLVENALQEYLPEKYKDLVEKHNLNEIE